jgi:hypothetical protein
VECISKEALLYGITAKLSHGEKTDQVIEVHGKLQNLIAVQFQTSLLSIPHVHSHITEIG